MVRGGPHTGLALDGMALDDAGGHRHGNFPAYYSFNPVEKRVALLPEELGAAIGQVAEGAEGRRVRMLDMGSNAGDLTVALARWLCGSAGRNVVGVGVELDPGLVERAAEMWAGEAEGGGGGGIELVFGCADATGDGAEGAIRALLESVGAGGRGEGEDDGPLFDVVFCFGLLMWIHVHVGDAGLRDFLARLCRLGAVVVVETHTWKNYKSCRERLRKKKLPLPPAFTPDALAMRASIEADVHDWLVAPDGCNMAVLMDLGRTNWGRPVRVYRQRAPAPL